MQDSCIAVPSVAAVVHVASDLEDPSYTRLRLMLPIGQDTRELLELREVTLFLGRKKTEQFEDWDNVADDRIEVIHLVVPDAITSLPHRAAFKKLLEEAQNHEIPLRNVEAQRNRPRHLGVAPGAKRNVEAAFSIHETGQIPADFRRDAL